MSDNTPILVLNERETRELSSPVTKIDVIVGEVFVREGEASTLVKAEESYDAGEGTAELRVYSPEGATITVTFLGV